MTGFDTERLWSALVVVVMALFVASGLPGVGVWRRPLRVAALVGFAVAAALALGESVLWLAHPPP